MKYKINISEVNEDWEVFRGVVVLLNGMVIGWLLSDWLFDILL